MGEKGAKRTALAGDAAALVLQHLDELGEVSSRKMFGGVGIFQNGTMFGIVDSKGGLFSKK